MKKISVFVIAFTSQFFTLLSVSAQVPFAVKLSAGVDYYQREGFSDLESVYSGFWTPAGYKPSVSNSLGFSPAAGISLMILDSSWLFPTIFLEGTSHVHSMGIGDYSAEFRLTTEISGIYTGVGFSRNFQIKGLSFFWKTGLVAIKVKSHETFESKIGDYDGLSSKPKSVEKAVFLFGAEPGISYDLPVFPGISLSTDLSWLVTTYASITPSVHNREMKLNKSKDLTINFTGFRARAGLIANLSGLF